VSEEPGTVEVSVDPNTCVGIGACIDAEPDAFELLDEGYSRAVPGARLSPESAEEVVAGCPSGAISIVTGPDGEQ
jgi:ferredoxin